ncbi:MAG TPA: serine hydrolase [Xanthobacteraceae bacterium]|jgi:beta-lactamase class C|nr:serine hydrolase [Xanthobacteraceae bacterium]
MRCTAAFMTAALAFATLSATTAARAETDAEIEQVVRRHVQPMLIAAGGMAVALHIDGRTLFFNYGMADVARKTPIASDSLFNLASVGKAFIATLLAQAVKQGEVSLDDPVAKYVTELQQGEIRKVTLGQLASHTSGLTRTPQQYEHRGPYKLPDFIRYLNAWQADAAHQPGQQDIYSNTGFVLLSLALQRRFNTPIAQLMETRLLAPLGMTSTALPVPRANARGQLAPDLRRRAVQGYNSDAQPVGEPGNQQGIFNWPGTGQMYSSARDMARFLAANLGALPNNPLQEAMALAQQGAFTVGPRFTQALAWQRVTNGDLVMVDKNGGLNNTATYIGMIPQRRLGIVILSNCGGEPATRIGRQIMLALARSPALVSEHGHKGD